MSKIKVVFGSILLVLLTILFSCNKKSFETLDENNEILSGGNQTVFDEGSSAFSHAFKNLSASQDLVHEIGDKAFEQTFVTAPAPIHGGLGPLYLNVSCVSCHVNDGRGKTPGLGETSASILYRISTSGNNEHGGPLSVLGFGDQIQSRSIQGTVGEADVTISYAEQTFSYPDGETYSLRFPTYTIINAYQNLPSGIMLSPRVASPVFGLGLLEAISENDILSNADENDANQDGISGKPNFVWNVVEQKATLGRFGWKANQPNLLQQTAGAYNGDMGITSFIFPQESSFGQIQHDNLNDDVEISDSLLHAVEFYVRTLAVPARRNITNENVKKGKQLFMQAKCNACHIESMKTAVNVAFPAISNQTIHAYTDLLLHDMGNDLADNRPDYLANGNEWRTPPLWGIGLTKKVNGHTQFLHDGRARNLTEAILWHGGESENSKNEFKKMSKQERESLIKFLESL